MGMVFFFSRGDEEVRKFIVVMVAQLQICFKKIELYTLNGLILWYVNSISKAI